MPTPTPRPSGGHDPATSPALSGAGAPRRGRLGIRFRLAGFGASAILATASILAGTGAWQSATFTDVAAGHVNDLTTAAATRASISVLSLTQAVAESIQSTQATNVAVATSTLNGAGGLHLDPRRSLAWTAVNQVDQTKQQVRLPAMLVGAQALGQNKDVFRPTVAIDDIATMLGASVTVFQRMDPAGDLLRVATTVKGKDDNRAIGTYIPARNADGSPNPVVAAINAGKDYQGVAQVVGTWFITAYTPARTADGTVIGAVFVGVPQDKAITALTRTITSAKVGEHGVAAVVSTAKADRGRVLAASDPQLAGTNLLHLQPGAALRVGGAEQAAWVEDVLRSSSQLQSGKTATFSAQLTGTGGAPEARSTLAATFYAPYSWAVVALSYGPDTDGVRASLVAGRARMLWTSLLAAAVLCLLGSLLAWVWASRMASRIAAITAAVSRLAARDLTSHVQVKGNDEIADMGAALNVAVDELHTLLTGITAAAGNVSASADRLRSAGHDVEDATDVAASQTTVATQAAEQIAANVATLAAASEEMTVSIAEISVSAQAAAASARTGVELAVGAGASMDALAQASEQISGVVATISTIAKQTNLLALNATIEAARSGEAGRGFAVVAEEVKALARQTSQATGEVEAKVAAILAGVQQAGSALEAIATRVEEVNDTQTAIAAAVEEQTATTTEMARNVSAAATGSEEISTLMASVQDTTTSARAATTTSQASVDDLVRTSQELHDLVNRFVV